jgi:hypothetical protein
MYVNCITFLNKQYIEDEKLEFEKLMNVEVKEENELFFSNFIYSQTPQILNF